MNSLIKIAVVLAFAAVASGNLPKAISQVRKAQFRSGQKLCACLLNEIKEKSKNLQYGKRVLL